MKDGKIARVKQKPCDLFPTEFYPSASNAGLVSFDGIQKEQQEVSFIKRNKTGKNILTSTRSPTDTWQSEPRTCAEGFTALSQVFKISLDLKGGEAEAGRGIAGQLNTHYSLSPAPRWVEKVPLVGTSTGS